MSDKDKQALADNEYVFPVARNLDYYGSEATEQDVENYALFVEEYLEQKAGTQVEIEMVERYERSDPLYDLRQDVWEAYCQSTN